MKQTQERNEPRQWLSIKPRQPHGGHLLEWLAIILLGLGCIALAFAAGWTLAHR